MSKSIIFLVKSLLANFYRHLAIFIWSHCYLPTYCTNKKGTRHLRNWDIFHSLVRMVSIRTDVTITHRHLIYVDCLFAPAHLPLLTVVVMSPAAIKKLWCCMRGQCIDLPLHLLPQPLYSSRSANYGRWAVYLFRSLCHYKNVHMLLGTLIAKCNLPKAHSD